VHGEQTKETTWNDAGFFPLLSLFIPMFTARHKTKTLRLLADQESWLERDRLWRFAVRMWLREGVVCVHPFLCTLLAPNEDAVGETSLWLTSFFQLVFLSLTNLKGFGTS